MIVEIGSEEIINTMQNITTMPSVYPNPLRLGLSANIDVKVKENESATLKIFNIKGPLVKEFQDIQGEEKIQ